MKAFACTPPDDLCPPRPSPPVYSEQEGRQPADGCCTKGIAPAEASVRPARGTPPRREGKSPRGHAASSAGRPGVPTASHPACRRAARGRCALRSAGGWTPMLPRAPRVCAGAVTRASARQRAPPVVPQTGSVSRFARGGQTTLAPWPPGSRGRSDPVAGLVAQSRDGRQRPGPQTAKSAAPWMAARVSWAAQAACCAPAGPLCLTRAPPDPGRPGADAEARQNPRGHQAQSPHPHTGPRGLRGVWPEWPPEVGRRGGRSASPRHTVCPGAGAVAAPAPTTCGGAPRTVAGAPRAAPPRRARVGRGAGTPEGRDGAAAPGTPPPAGPTARAARQEAGRQHHPGAGASRRARAGQAARWGGGAAGGVGRALAGSHRPGGHTPQGATAPGPSGAPPGGGARGLGAAHALPVVGADVAPSGSPLRQHESRGGGGPQALGAPVPAPPGGACCCGGVGRAPVPRPGGTGTPAGHPGA